MELEAKIAWGGSEEGRSFMTASSAAWAEAQCKEDVRRPVELGELEAGERRTAGGGGSGGRVAAGDRAVNRTASGLSQVPAADSSASLAAAASCSSSRAALSCSGVGAVRPSATGSSSGC